MPTVASGASGTKYSVAFNAGPSSTYYLLYQCASVGSSTEISTWVCVSRGELDSSGKSRCMSPPFIYYLSINRSNQVPTSHPFVSPGFKVAVDCRGRKKAIGAAHHGTLSARGRRETLLSINPSISQSNSPWRHRDIVMMCIGIGWS